MLRTASGKFASDGRGGNLSAAAAASASGGGGGGIASWATFVKSKMNKRVLAVAAFWLILLATQYVQYEALGGGGDLDDDDSVSVDAGFDDDDDFITAGEGEVTTDPEDDTMDYSDVFAAALAASKNGETTSPWDSVHRLILDKPLQFRARLPRSTSRPYNFIPKGLKAFSYSPSGGYNNQLRCLIAAIVLCKQADRALLVPMAGPHTNFARNYLKNTLNSLVPMDQLVDFEYLERQTGVPLIPLNMTLNDFRQKRVGGLRLGQRTPRAWIFQIGTPLSWIVERGVREHENRIRNYQGRVLIYIGPFYTRHWQEDWVINSVRYTSYLRGLSKHIANEALGGGHFNAVHLRLGDYIKLALTKSKDARAYVNRGKEYGFDDETPVYVATDQPSHRADGSLNNYFRPFGTFKNLLFARDLAKHPGTAAALLDFKNRLPNNAKIASDMFGLVEQLICARSHIFVGTSVSTFSKTINSQRANLLNTIPEIEPSLVSKGRTLLIRWSGYIDVDSKVRMRAEDPVDEEEEARNKARQADEAAALAQEEASAAEARAEEESEAEPEEANPMLRANQEVDEAMGAENEEETEEDGDVAIAIPNPEDQLGESPDI